MRCAYEPEFVTYELHDVGVHATRRVLRRRTLLLEPLPPVHVKNGEERNSQGELREST
jgi:hypothetical protein